MMSADKGGNILFHRQMIMLFVNLTDNHGIDIFRILFKHETTAA